MRCAAKTRWIGGGYVPVMVGYSEATAATRRAKIGSFYSANSAVMHAKL